MAGIGVRLNRIFEKNTLTTNMIGFFYSTLVTVAPMFAIIINLVLMEYFLKFSTLGYAQRELFSCTILYTFIFSLLTASPFNAVLSRYMSDIIYEERYQDILPCYHIGMVLNIALSCLIGIPFCLWEHFVGGVSVAYVFAGFWCYISLVLVFYSMIYLSICKDYQRIAQYYGAGMLLAFFLSLFLRYVLHWGITQSMLAAMDAGFFLTAVLENALIKRYFRKNSNRYKPVLVYFKKYWQLVVTNFLYILGLYIHNFVFWKTDMKMVVVNSFVCNQPYDMASCLAMFTNISATIIFISRVEMYFHEKYKLYSEAVIGGRGDYRIQLNGKHDADHTREAQVLTISFNQNVTYVSGGAGVIDGNGTPTLRVKLGYHQNPSDNIGLGDLVVTSDAGLAITGVSITD